MRGKLLLAGLSCRSWTKLPRFCELPAVVWLQEAGCGGRPSAFLGYVIGWMAVQVAIDVTGVPDIGKEVRRTEPNIVV